MGKHSVQGNERVLSQILVQQLRVGLTPSVRRQNSDGSFVGRCRLRVRLGKVETLFNEALVFHNRILIKGPLRLLQEIFGRNNARHRVNDSAGGSAEIACHIATNLLTITNDRFDFREFTDLLVGGHKVVGEQLTNSWI